VAGHILSDAELLLAEGSSRVVGNLAELGVRPYVDKLGWSCIDAAEVALGQREGRDRGKIWNRDELLRESKRA
jgi:hypothetical protein